MTVEELGLERQNEQPFQLQFLGDLDEFVDDMETCTLPLGCRIDCDGADLTQVCPQHMQSAAGDYLITALGDPELLDGLVQRHEILLEQDLAGVDVDEALDFGDVRRSRATHDQLALGIGRRGRSHVVHISQCPYRYSKSRACPPHAIPAPLGFVPGSAHRLCGDPMSTPRDQTDAHRAAVGPSDGTPVADNPVPLLNIANILTMVRMVLVPVFLVVLFVDGGHSTWWRLGAMGVFIVAAITDRIDGQLARKYGLVTDFGKLMDPIADKALIGAALIGLSVLGDLSWWVTGVIIARELGITLLRFAVLRHAVIPAGKGGKLKTLVQAVAIGFYLCPLPSSWDIVSGLLMAAAVVLTVATGIEYIVQAIRLRAGVRAVES